MVEGMAEWLRIVAAVATPVVAVAALIVSIWASQRVRRKREFEILLEEIRHEARERQERIDREAAKREAETRAITERIDREAAKREELFEREAAKREELFEREAAKREQRIDREAAKREERIDREAAKREEAIQMLMDRSDRKFEALLARSDALASQSAGVVERVVRTETRLEALRSADHRAAADPSAPATGETEAVAAQGLPDEPRPE